jgi:uncharacterized protein (TIGR02001 family)
MRRRLKVLTGWGLGLSLGLVAASGARAGEGQLGGAVSLDSDYRLRGVSLTSNRSALAFSLAYDHSSGAYAGAAVVVHDFADSGGRLLGHMEYVGYAAQGPGGYAWDVGIDNQDFVPYGPQRFHLRYSEAYVGVSKGDLSARVYYSPNYLPSWGTTVYLDLNGVLRPADNWRLSGHAGALVPAGGGDGPVRTRYDLRLGVARDFKAGEIRANFTTAFPTPQALSSRTGPALVVGASVFF